jgi:hypothetical protein
VVVDAGRKTADTAVWVAEVASVLTIDALAVVGVVATGSPETVDRLGLPIGWVDGGPATATTIAATTIAAPPIAAAPIAAAPGARARLA